MGSVQMNMDLLLRHALPVVSVVRVRVRLCLAARPGAVLEDVSRAASHPVALEQCRGFFARSPTIEAVAAFDTAGSIRDLMAGEADHDAAIGSELAASLYGADILERDLEDDRQNYTRFLVVAPEPTTPPQEGANDLARVPGTSRAGVSAHRPRRLRAARRGSDPAGVTADSWATLGVPVLRGPSRAVSRGPARSGGGAWRCRRRGPRPRAIPGGAGLRVIEASAPASPAAAPPR